MSAKKNYWTVPHEDGWAVKGEGNQKATSVHSTQADAWAETIERAKSSESEAFLQSRDGRIRERNSYGNDPHPPKG